MSFSALDKSLNKFASDVEVNKLKLTLLPFTKSEATNEKRIERLLLAKDFWNYDKIYFDKKVYSDGYSEPADFHRFLASLWCIPGVHTVLGPRKHAKTAISKKLFVWLLVNNYIDFGGTLSSTLPTSRNILADLVEIIMSDKIMYDFKPDILENNADQFTFRLPHVRGTSRISAFSEGRSVRGATKLFSRPKFILCDDLETRQSSLSDSSAEDRIDILKEAYQSMSENGSMLVLGNNFSEKCALNRLLQEQKNGILPPHWRVYSIPAWGSDESRFGAGPLWKSRFPAQSENELKKMCGAMDESEWQGDFQQNPIPPDGFYFSRNNLAYYDELPKDVKGVLYCDPNLSLKSKGDTTAITSLLYSPNTNCYYVDSISCQSFSNSVALLTKVLGMKNERHRALGFDGNVNQESTWSNHVSNFCDIKKIPFPYIKYCKFKVDELAKNTQAVWCEGRILFNRALENSTEFKEYLIQLFAFAGKKAGKKDDAPDSLICAYELLHLRNLARSSTKGNFVTLINDFYF